MAIRMARIMTILGAGRGFLPKYAVPVGSGT